MSVQTSSQRAGGPAGDKASLCPVCGVGHWEFDRQWARCDSCGHTAPASFVRELLRYESQYSVLLRRREWLREQIIAGPTGLYVSDALAQTPQPHAIPPSREVIITGLERGAPRAAHPAKPHAEPRHFSTSSALYILGAVLVVIAIVGVAALTWEHLGVLGQALIIGVGAIALAVIAHFTRKKIFGLSVTLAALASVTIPVALLQASQGLDTNLAQWMPLIAFASGTVFCLACWWPSRIESYVWAGAFSAELALFATAIPLSSAFTALSPWAIFIALIGSTAVVYASTLGKRRPTTLPPLIAGSVGLIAAMILTPFTYGWSESLYVPSVLYLVAGGCLLALSSVWWRRRLAGALYVAWISLFAALALASGAAGWGLSVRLVLPTLLVSLVALVLAAFKPTWPRAALPIIASIALVASVLAGFGGMLTLGTAEWGWKLYVGLAGAAIVALRPIWLRFGRTAANVATVFGAVVTTFAVASIALFWAPTDAIPPGTVAIPLLAWSVVLLLASLWKSWDASSIVGRVGAAGLGVTSALSLLAFVPDHRFGWALVGVSCAAVGVLCYRPLTRVGIDGQVVRIAIALTLGVPYGLALASLSIVGDTANYVTVIVTTLGIGLVAVVFDLLDKSRQRWDVVPFVAAAWASGLFMIVSTGNPESNDINFAVGLYLLITAVFMALATWRRGWFVLGWCAAVVASVGWVLVTIPLDNPPIEARSLAPTAFLLAAGLYMWHLRDREGKATSSYGIFTPAIVAGCLPSLLVLFAEGLADPGARWFILVAVATGLTVAGAVWRLAGIFIPAVVVLVLALLPQVVNVTVTLLTVIPGWVFFAVIGLLLIAAAARLEWVRSVGRHGRQWFKTLT